MDESKEYVMYRGDEVLAVGTACELSGLLGIKVSTIHFYASPAWHKRAEASANPDKALIVIRVDDQEEDDE